MHHFNLTQIFKSVFFLSLFFLFNGPIQITFAQIQSNQTIDIDSRAKELGITSNEFTGILNSTFRNNGGGDPLPEALQDPHGERSGRRTIVPVK